jgi:hypothetical protein
MENWKQILGLDVVDDLLIHLISDRGRVLTINNGKATFRLGYNDVNGYLSLTFGHKDRRSIHRLVGEYFLAPKEGAPCINHKDGDKHNNRVENLEWVTYAENNQHAYDTGLNPGNSKLTKEQVFEVYKLKKEGKRLREISKLVDINYSALKDIYSGKNWKFEYEKFFGEGYKKTGRGGKASWNSIPEEKVLIVYARKKERKRIFEIAKELGLGFHTVKHIFHGKNWKHLYKEHFG